MKALETFSVLFCNKGHCIRKDKLAVVVLHGFVFFKWCEQSINDMTTVEKVFLLL